MDEKIVGGKAYNLDILTKNGIPVPKWFVVTSTEESFEVREDKLYAVRSSAVGEDGSGNSFAGHMESFLYVKAEDIKDMQPYEIDHNVFENYAVDVKMCSCDEENFEVIIADNGIGLSADQLKAVCDVGVSYAGDKKKKEEIESMPLWLRPTAGFGIGLQSIFLIADEFEIYSKASGTEGIYAKVTSRRRNGYVQITKSDKRKEQGTEIHVVLPKDINFSYGFLG